MKSYTFTLLAIVLFLGCDKKTESNRFDAQCIADSEGTYPKQENSDYVLPWAVGETFIVSQGNCTNGSHSVKYKEQYGYDFSMAIGTHIHAARSGVVIELEESFVDGTRRVGEHNFIAIRHADNSVARYIHLTKDGALVELADTIQQGDLIALSGNTGYSTGPHLHFDVVDGDCFDFSQSCQTQPTTFLNTIPHATGLVEEDAYTAFPY